MAGRSKSHVPKKRFERIAPLVANIDASGSVVFVIEAMGLMASASHIHPSLIFRGAIHAVFAMNDFGSFAGQFPCETTATF
jgi:hypothetical protein